jgi:hypothetical protein
VVNASFIVSGASTFINLGTRFLLWGKGCSTLCYDFPKHLH